MLPKGNVCKNVVWCGVVSFRAAKRCKGVVRVRRKFMFALMLVLLIGVMLVPAEAAVGDTDTGIWGGIEWTFVVTDQDGTGTMTISPLGRDNGTNPRTGITYTSGFWREGI